jgi:hypothetical protein
MNALPAGPPDAHGSGQSLREVRRGVVAARDTQVLQVVRMVDALADRGTTDAVLDPVRPRLRAIQPARPLRFARLLFMPLDPLVVASRAWRPGTPFLPRTALPVLASVVRLVASPDGPAQAGIQVGGLARVDTLIEGATTARADVARLAGGVLWPYAASILRHLASAEPSSDLLGTCLASWVGHGLAKAELQPMAASLAPVLSHATALHDHEHAGQPLTEAALLGMLASAQAAGQRACATMLSLLVLRVPACAAALLEAARRSGVRQELVDTVTDSAIAWVEAEAGAQTGGVGDADAAAICRQAELLDALSGQCGATRRRRLTETRSRLLAGCLDRFEEALQAQVAAPLQALPADPALRDEALDAMEAASRTLRRFEMESRRLGAGARFDTLAQRAAAAVAHAAPLSGMDRARLVEILLGGEAARQVIAAQDAP